MLTALPCTVIVPPSLRDQRLWLAVGLASVPLAWWLVSGRRTTRPQSPRTDFNGFLKATDTPVVQGAAGAPKPAPAKPQHSATSFASFLKQPADAPPSRDSTSFSSFLKRGVTGTSGGDGTAQEVAVAAAPTGPTISPESIPITVVYGTEFGFAKEIAEKLRDQLAECKLFWPRLLDMADVPQGLDLSKEQALLCICSTQGDGVPPSEARDFCDWLHSPAALRLDGNHFSVLALGDRSYQHYCKCGSQLDTRFEALGGARLLPRCDVNREDWSVVDAWLAAVLGGLPSLPLKTVTQLGGYTSLLEGAAPSPPVQAASRRWGKSRPFHSAVVAIQGLCAVESTDDKNTYRVELDLADSGLHYAPGDALGIYPQNAPEAVKELLEAMGASAEHCIAMPSWHYEEPAQQGQPRTHMPLAEALAKCFDLRVPKPELLRLLLSALPAADTKDAPAPGPASGEAAEQPPISEQAEQLRALVAGGAKAYLEVRHVLDVLLDFPAARIQVEQVLGALRPLQARLYSISSSPREAPARVQVTVAVVHYVSLARSRAGVTSTYLAERLEVGMLIPVFVSRNPDFRLPAAPSTPIIMVGPGTGLAPFRAFVQERLLSVKGGSPAGVLGSDSGSASALVSSGSGSSLSGPAPSETLSDASTATSIKRGMVAEAMVEVEGACEGLGDTVLYFGCRRRDQDYLYGELLDSWAADGTLTLFTAFSREQAGKVYVQDRLRESGGLVWRLLQRGAHFYVCGDAAHMAGSVEEALLEIIAQHQGSGAGEAQVYLDSMSASERYQRDVWY